MLIVLGILLLVSLVIVHELGHFWAARRAGIEVEEFGIGFPPKAKTLGKRNGTEYTLNWLPLGGFVKLKGEHDSDTTKGSFGAATLRDKVAVMVAGVFMNVVAAIVLLTFVALLGVPRVIDGQFSVASDVTKTQHDVVVGVVDDTPASEAGLEDGDIIRSFTENGCAADDCTQAVEDAAALRGITESLAGKTVTVTYQDRDSDEIQQATTTLLTEAAVEASRDTDSPKGYFGVVPSDLIRERYTWSAPIVGTVLTGQFFYETLRGLGALVADLFQGDTQTAREQVTGVVGIGYVLSELSQQGIGAVLFLSGIISISLAVMNILPIPALDGGRLFVTLLFRGLRKPLTKETEERIHGTGFAVLMLLFVLITFLDVQRFILN